MFDVETGFDSTLLNLNPDGWIEGVTTEKSWRMLYGMDVGVERQLIIAGARPTDQPSCPGSKTAHLRRQACRRPKGLQCRTRT